MDNRDNFLPVINDMIGATPSIEPPKEASKSLKEFISGLKGGVIPILGDGTKVENLRSQKPETRTVTKMNQVLSTRIAGISIVNLVLMILGIIVVMSLLGRK